MTKFSIEPKSGFLDEVCSQIHKKERSFYIKRIVIFSSILSICALVFVPTLKMLISDINSSGFLQFILLIFYDTTIIAKFWKNFILVLAGSLPAISLAMFLAVVLGIMQSAKYLSRDIQFITKAKT